MGRGDKKTAKGKRFKGSFGNSRPHKLTVKVAAPSAAKAEKAAKKAAAAPKKAVAPKKAAAPKKTEE